MIYKVYSQGKYIDSGRSSRELNLRHLRNRLVHKVGHHRSIMVYAFDDDEHIAYERFISN